MGSPRAPAKEEGKGRRRRGGKEEKEDAAGDEYPRDDATGPMNGAAGTAGCPKVFKKYIEVVKYNISNYPFVFTKSCKLTHTLYVPCFPCHHFCGSRRGRSLLPPSSMLDSPLEKKSHAHLWVHTTSSPALHVKNKSGEGESQSREEEEERFTSRNQDNFFPFSTLVFFPSLPLPLSAIFASHQRRKKRHTRRRQDDDDCLRCTPGYFFRDLVRVSC